MASAKASETVLASVKAYREGWSRLAQWQGQTAMRPAAFDGRAQLALLKTRAPWLFE